MDAPQWALIRRDLRAPEIGEAAGAVLAALDTVADVIAPGSSVCLAVGSRGMDRLAEVILAAVTRLRSLGCQPFIVPAMGSHGGGTAEGQTAVLASYGVTEEAMTCEIRSTMDVVRTGTIRAGVPVYMDRYAHSADFVIPVNRIKPHTDFTAPTESGLLKMIAIGLGNRHGADALHMQGFDRFATLIPEAAAINLARGKIPFGLALIENAYGRLLHVEAVTAEDIAEREPTLLRIAREAMGRLPFARIDVLILDRIGKDVSGLGMDSNVVGRYYHGPTGEPPAIQRIVVRDLTPATAGNAVGIGLADVVLRRAVSRMDAAATYTNVITAKTPEGARVPLTVGTDREAVNVALACCLRVVPSTARLVRVRDTKHLDWMFASAPALQEILDLDDCEVVNPLHPMQFDASGMFREELPFEGSRASDVN